MTNSPQIMLEMLNVSALCAVTWLSQEFHLGSYINIFGINNERASPLTEYDGPTKT